jgi:aspartokinase/homoserine dehydrogenase 1
MSIEVCKFGGVSVGTPPNIKNALSVVEKYDKPVVVVVSAMRGITDQLFKSAELAVSGDLSVCLETCVQMTKRYEKSIKDLINDEKIAEELRGLSKHYIDEFKSMCQGLHILKEGSSGILDCVVARGERFNARLFNGALNCRGILSSYVDGSDVIILSKQFENDQPDFDLCQRACTDVILPLLKTFQVVVVPGFIAKGPDGKVKTLGRGGSDYSATLLGHGLDASRVTLYKEVDGLMTADPKYVKAARTVPELHYREATELAYYGAKVLHSRTIMPLMEKNIPLLIRRSSRPEYSGTLVSNSVKPGLYPVKSLTAMTGQVLISIEGNGMMGVPGMAGKTFSSLAQEKISVSFISQSSSEASICFVVSKDQAIKAKEILHQTFQWELKLRLINKILVTDNLAIIAVVGLGMEGTPGIAARTFKALAQQSINIIAIAQGSSELNISFAVNEDFVQPALQSLHDEYRLDKIQALPSKNGKNIDLCIYGIGQIGRTLITQMIDQQQYFSKRLKFQCNYLALADRSGLWLNTPTLLEDSVREAISIKEKKLPLVDGDNKRAYAFGRKQGIKALFDLPLHRGIFVDLTADETDSVILEALEHNFHIVLANKKPLSVDQKIFDRMFEIARRKKLKIRYEATVGAGLPILDTLDKLESAGDKIISINGCLSGTLGYILSSMENGKSFSESVRDAYEKGFTEPDPREDLSGMDVARKALILARTLGHRINMSDIEVRPFYREELSHDDPEIFLNNLKQQDEEMNDTLQRAFTENKTLRYVASITKESVTVGLRPLSKNSSLGRLPGTNNQVTICSERYKENPLIVTGPGAGAAVTAAGVLNDIVAIAMMDE